MKKTEQTAINQKVLAALDAYNQKVPRMEFLDPARLRCSSAYVQYATDPITGEILYSVLTSYHTVVAIIDHSTDTLYDFLRYVYGYTSTSAQHISKFSKDYGSGKWGCANRMTYKEV